MKKLDCDKCKHFLSANLKPGLVLHCLKHDIEFDNGQHMDHIAIVEKCLEERDENFNKDKLMQEYACSLMETEEEIKEYKAELAACENIEYARSILENADKNRGKK